MRIAVIDDDPEILTWFNYVLEGAGHQVVTASDGEAGLALILEQVPHLSLVDLKMPKKDGLELIQKAIKAVPTTQMILMTAHGTIRTAVEAMRLGAVDYLTKPLDKDEVLITIDKAAAKITLTKENILLKSQVEKMTRGDIFLTENPGIKRLLEQARSVAQTDTTVLITGENGTGKEVFAKYIYRNSNRSNKQFVVVSCAALSEQLLESELFGHAKGAFTSAHADHAGYFEIADGGTIFLDETGELTPAIQVKLLRVLQEREYSRVGETKTRQTDVRIIAATNQDLLKLIDEGKFREDFYYRINVFDFNIPPLRDRAEDIATYFEMFIREFMTQMNKKFESIDPAVLEILSSYKWPGNIRELKNIAERTSILVDPSTGIISPDLVPDRITWSSNTRPGYAGNDYKKAKELMVRNFEVNFITRQLRKQRGNVAATAREIDVHPVFLRQKIAALGINAKSFKD